MGLPNVHFGSVLDKPVDWRKLPDKDAPDDDQPLAKTPADVTEILGFDPLELA